MSDHYQHKFPVEKRHKLHRPERLEKLKPEAFVQWAGIEAEMTVADIGCGTGLFARAAAEQVGPDGKVYALDIAEPMVEYVREQSPPEHLEVLQCGENTFPVGDGKVDVVILASVLHEALDREAFAAEIHRILTAGGRVASLEWKPIEQTKGPPLAGRIPPQEWREIFTEADFHIETIESWNASRYAALATNASNSQ